MSASGCQGTPVLVPDAHTPRTDARTDAGAAAPVRAVPAIVIEARRAIREHRRREAAELLLAAGPLGRSAPERTFLLLALEAEGVDLRVARQRAAALPRDAFGNAMRALVEPSPHKALAQVAAVEPWGALVEAIQLARLGRGERAYRAAAGALTSPLALVRAEARAIRAQALLERGRLEAARAEIDRASAYVPSDARLHLLAADIHRRRGALAAATGAYLMALAQAPRSETIARALADYIRHHVPEETAEAGALPEPSGLPQGVQPEDNPELMALRGLLLQRRGALVQAQHAYQAALDHGANPVPFDRELRRIHFEHGNHPAGVRLLLEAVPPDVRRDPVNRLHEAWQRLEGWAACGVEGPFPNTDREALASTLMRVGALQEARAVLANIATASGRALDRRIAGHLAFEAALREGIEAGYLAEQKEERAPGLDAVLAQMPRWAAAHLAPVERTAFTRPQRGLRSAPLIGRWLDHGTDTTSPIVRHFRTYGRFLMLGQRSGQPPEAIVLSLASLTRAQEIPSIVGTLRHDVAVGYDRSVRGYIAAEGGVLGGACLPDGIWLDADAARSTEITLRRILAREPERVARARRQLATPIASPDDPEAWSFLDLHAVRLRLLDDHVRANPDDVWGSFRTLRSHEYGHLVDLRRHLPIWRGLPASIGLLFERGFSPHRIESHLEERAQLSAVAFSPHPRLALLEMMLGLPIFTDEPRVHDAGYAAGLLQMLRLLEAEPQVPFDRLRRRTEQLDRVPNPMLRAVARRALR